MTKEMNYCKNCKISKMRNRQYIFRPESMVILKNPGSRFGYPIIWNCKNCPLYLLTERAARNHVKTCNKQYLL